MTMRPRLAGLLAATAGTLLLLATPAGAQPSDDPDEQVGIVGATPLVPICAGDFASGSGLGITIGDRVPGQETCDSVAAEVADLAGR